MGMSLEDVQYKFASIVEALSKSPHTLSQFFVWLDLCVAEYKSNGVIRLNCSGEKPSPAWLEGLKEDDNSQKIPEQSMPSESQGNSSVMSDVAEGNCLELTTDGAQHLPEPTAQRNTCGQKTTKVSKGTSTEENCGSETLPVTENSTNCVYPVGWIQIGSGNHSETVPIVEANNNNNSSTPDEEFLQVIQTPDKTTRNSVVKVPQNVQNVVRLVQMTEESPSTSQQGTGNVRLSSKFDQQTPPVLLSNMPVPICSIKTESESCDTDVYNNNNNKDVPPGYMVFHIDNAGELSPSSKTRASANWWPPSEIHRGNRRPAPYIPGPVRKARTNVGNMHRWLREEHNEFRHIEEIPHEELDPYITKFLRLVRRKDGRDYDPNSFRDVRGSIERYLRDHGYPHSIVKSSLFYNSQRAYYNKKQELRHSLFLRNSEQDKSMSVLYY